MSKNKFFSKENRKFFIDDIEGISEYVKENCMEEAEKIIAVANDVVNQSFLFTLRWDKMCIRDRYKLILIC